MPTMKGTGTERPAGIDLDASTAWLEGLDGPLEGRGLFRTLLAIPHGRGPMCLPYAIDDESDRDRVLQRLADGAVDFTTIAYGLGALSHRPEGGRRGCGVDVAVVSTFAVDLDLKHSSMAKDEARDRLTVTASKADLPVSALIDSGHGLHLYFMLRAPWVMATKDDRLAYEERQRWLADAFGGDHTTDLARALRLPGTWNRKDPADPLLCKVLVWDPTAHTEPDQIPRSARKQLATRAPAHVPEAGGSAHANLPPPLAEAESAAVTGRLKRLARADKLLRLALSDELHCTSQSHQDFMVLCCLLRLGLADREALHVARAVRATREGGTSAKNARDDYWSATLTNVHRTLTTQE